MIQSNSIQITPEILSLVAGIDEFKGAWRTMGTLAPDRLSALLRVATIESIGSSTRIEGSKLSDRDVERLLSNLQIRQFSTRDEQEVAGYAKVMGMVFTSWQDIALTENHIRQLHRDLLVYSDKDGRPARAQHLGGVPDIEPIHPGCAFVGLDPLPRPVQVLSRQRRPQQTTGARLRLCRPCVRVLMGRTAGFVADWITPGFTARYARPPGSLRHLTHGLVHPHVFGHSLSFGPSCFWIGLRRPPTRTTTASADFSLQVSPSPFQAQGEISPGKGRTPSSHNRQIYAA